MQRYKFLNYVYEAMENRNYLEQLGFLNPRQEKKGMARRLLNKSRGISPYRARDLFNFDISVSSSAVRLVARKKGGDDLSHPNRLFSGGSRLGRTILTLK